jgi:hypothetical protein
VESNTEALDVRTWIDHQDQSLKIVNLQKACHFCLQTHAQYFLQEACVACICMHTHAETRRREAGREGRRREEGRKETGCQWLMPVMLASALEAEIRRMEVQSQPDK